MSPLRVVREGAPAEVAVFVGLQGSGKSTFYRTQLAATHTLVSRDLMRNNRAPSRRQRQLISEALARGESVAVDNTNATLADRAELVDLARAYGVRAIAYFFTPDVAAALRRNAGRQGKARVPEVAIFATRKRLVPPSFEEGFDRVFVVEPLDSGGFRVRERSAPLEDQPPR